MKILSFFKNLALTAAILGSTQLYGATQMTPQQMHDMQIAQQNQADLAGQKAMAAQQLAKQQAATTQQDAAAQQQQYMQQQRMAMQQQQFQQGLQTQLSQAGKFLNVTNPTQLQDAINSARGNEGLINAILKNYESKNYPPVTKLSLNGLGLSRIPEALRDTFYLRSLQTLSLIQNRLENLAGIGDFKNLTSLTVGLNKIADISEIQFLPKLTYFSAVRCNLTNASLDFPLPQSLQTLVLDGNRIESPFPPMAPKYHFQDALRGVSIQGNPLTNFCWIHTTRNLQSLRVDNATFQNVVKRNTPADDYCIALAQSKMPKA